MSFYMGFLILRFYNNGICSLEKLVILTNYGKFKPLHCLSISHFYWFLIVNLPKMLTKALTRFVTHTQLVLICLVYVLILLWSANWVCKSVTSSFCHHFKPGHQPPDSARTSPDPDRQLTTFCHNQNLLPRHIWVNHFFFFFICF